MSADDKVFVDLVDDEVYPVTTVERVDANDWRLQCRGTSEAYEVTPLELRRLEALERLESRVHGVFNRLLQRVERRGRVHIHLNDDGTVVKVMPPALRCAQHGGDVAQGSRDGCQTCDDIIAGHVHRFHLEKERR